MTAPLETEHRTLAEYADTAKWPNGFGTCGVRGVFLRGVLEYEWCADYRWRDDHNDRYRNAVVIGGFGDALASLAEAMRDMEGE